MINQSIDRHCGIQGAYKTTEEANTHAFYLLKI